MYVCIRDACILNTKDDKGIAHGTIALEQTSTLNNNSQNNPISVNTHIHTHTPVSHKGHIRAKHNTLYHTYKSIVDVTLCLKRVKNK